MPGGTTLTKSIKKPGDTQPTSAPSSDEPTPIELIPIDGLESSAAPAPAATEAANAGDAEEKDKDKDKDKSPEKGQEKVAITRTGDDAHATTIMVDGVPTVSVYFTVTVTEKDQPTATVTEKETVTLVISA